MAAADFLADNPYAQFGTTVAEAQPSERVAFVRKTYLHLAVAIYALVGLERFYITSGFADWLVPQVAGMPFGMLLMFGGFLIVSYVADRWAQSETSIAQQYTGLVLYVVAQSVFLLPMLWFAQSKVLEISPGQEVGVISAAAVTTLVMFAGLTAIAWFSGKDFSFLGAGLGVAGLAIFGAILVSMVVGVNLGVWFSVALIVFASAYILYDTSNVMHHYRPDQHVAASLALFASVALLFWYVLRLFIALSSRD